MNEKEKEERKENEWIITHTPELQTKFCVDRSEEFYEFAQEEYQDQK